jgi:hypothetical protein
MPAAVKPVSDKNQAESSQSAAHRRADKTLPDDF